MMAKETTFEKNDSKKTELRTRSGTDQLEINYQIMMQIESSND